MSRAQNIKTAAAAIGRPASAAAGDQAPFRLRFRAWWDGRSLADVIAEEARRAAAQALTAEDEGAADAAGKAVVENSAPDPDPDPDLPWTPSRIAIHEAVFGPGAVAPGGSERTLDMISAFGLGREVNVLELGSELGGAARAIARKCDAWVTGYEPDPVLAAAAMAPERCAEVMSGGSLGRSSQSFKIKLADKARIERADLTALQFKPGIYDCAFAREFLHRVAEPAPLLEETFIGLKPSCPLLLTDYFVVEGKENHPDLRSWLDTELQPLRLRTVEEVHKMLTEIGYDLRISDDITAQYRQDLFNDLRRFVGGHETTGVPPRLVRPLLMLGETWARRLMALDAGLVTIHKLVALRTGG